MNSHTTTESTGNNPSLSIVTPAYHEEDNLPVLYQRLSKVLELENIDWEWIIVDDHSTDNTYTVIEQLALQDHRIKGIRLAKNSGAHIALTCGLHASHGQCVIALAGDLQDPPETIPELLEKWRQGAQVIWAVREAREGESPIKKLLARFYYLIMRKVVGMSDLPAEGADFFLLDRTVVNAFRQFNEKNVSIFALITWMGFKQCSIYYTKHARLHGRSGWTFKKKLKLLVDSITAFSYFPIRFMSYFGILIALAGFIYASIVIYNAISGTPPTGWASLIVIALVIGGFQISMMGVLGEYLWRSLDESRGRPAYFVESMTRDLQDRSSQPT